MIDNLTDSDIEKIIDLTYLIIEVVTADREVMHFSDAMMTLTMIMQRSLRS